MAIAAAKMAIEDAGIDKTEIGVVIVATIRPDHMTPSVACMVQKELELPQDIPCFDINAACSGFMYGCTDRKRHAVTERQEIWRGYR